MRDDRLERHLRENAGRYFPDLATARDLRLERAGAREGPLSSVRRYRLVAGDVEHGVVVKRPPAASDPRPLAARPRVAPLLDPATKLLHEGAALRALAAHLAARGGDRFACVRVLDLLECGPALLMEETRGRSLTRALARASRPLDPLGSGDLRGSLESLGAWLRAYHELPPLAHTRARSASRDEFVDSVRRLTAYLDARLSLPRSLRALADRTQALAGRWLPRDLPLATSHGDLAPRNVIVDAAGRVHVIDTRAAWSAPLYEDLAYFLTAIRTPRVQAGSLGLAFGDGALRRLERAFLRGYFEQAPPPLERIRLFEIQTLLDKWASQTEARALPARRAVAHAYRDWCADRLFQRELAARLSELERAAPSQERRGVS